MPQSSSTTTNPYAGLHLAQYPAWHVSRLARVKALVRLVLLPSFRIARFGISAGGGVIDGADAVEGTGAGEDVIVGTDTGVGASARVGAGGGASRWLDEHALRGRCRVECSRLSHPGWGKQWFP